MSDDLVRDENRPAASGAAQAGKTNCGPDVDLLRRFAALSLSLAASVGCAPSSLAPGTATLTATVRSRSTPHGPSTLPSPNTTTHGYHTNRGHQGGQQGGYHAERMSPRSAICCPWAQTTPPSALQHNGSVGDQPSDRPMTGARRRRARRYHRRGG